MRLMTRPRRRRAGRSRRASDGGIDAERALAERAGMTNSFFLFSICPDATRYPAPQPPQPGACPQCSLARISQAKFGHQHAASKSDAVRQFGNILWLPNLRIEDDIKPDPISAAYVRFFALHAGVAGYRKPPLSPPVP